MGMGEALKTSTGPLVQSGDSAGASTSWERRLDLDRSCSCGMRKRCQFLLRTQAPAQRRRARVLVRWSGRDDVAGKKERQEFHVKEASAGRSAMFRGAEARSHNCTRWLLIGNGLKRSRFLWGLAGTRRSVQSRRRRMTTELSRCSMTKRKRLRERPRDCQPIGGRPARSGRPPLPWRLLC